MTPLKIGITGGIGSGKTTITYLLEQKGYLVYFADARAKWLMQNDSTLVKQLKDLLGADIYTTTGELNKQLVARRVFENSTLLQKMNAIVHPAVKLDFFSWVQQNQKEKFLFKEAAILLEAQTQDQIDFSVLVYAPKKIRMQRVTNRDNVDFIHVLHRMNQQWPERLKYNYVDYIIFNDNIHSLEKQVVELLNFLHKQFG
ncbi:MAG: dephospho-CoA kinase [Bacteroidia bacterium]|nr:dephospho-CoA kinase [Bacteroidia bacterium]MDW8158943.1 dephospho-CoA kinase [Bacteroidia bacterium]